MEINIRAGGSCWSRLEWQFNVLPSICVTKAYNDVLEICFSWLFWYVFFRIKHR